MEIIKLYASPLEQYYLQFENEQDYIIKKFIDDLRQYINENPNCDLSMKKDGNFTLEFSDLKEISFYDQFQLPYYWHFHPNVNLHSIVDSPYCNGIVFSYNYLHQLHESGNFFSFITEFMKVAKTKIERGDLKLVLSQDWDSDLFPSLFDFLPIELISIAINYKVELSYRQADIPKITREIKHYHSVVE